MLYQLSYSPKELDNLASTFSRYSSAVRTEADVYPKLVNPASSNRKKEKRPAPDRSGSALGTDFLVVGPDRDQGDRPCSADRDYFLAGAGAAAFSSFFFAATSLRIAVTTPAPTVLPPSRIAKRRPPSHAIGETSST